MQPDAASRLAAFGIQNIGVIDRQGPRTIKSRKDLGSRLLVMK